MATENWRLHLVVTGWQRGKIIGGRFRICAKQLTTIGFDTQSGCAQREPTRAQNGRRDDSGDADHDMPLEACDAPRVCTQDKRFRIDLHAIIAGGWIVAHGVAALGELRKIAPAEMGPITISARNTHNFLIVLAQPQFCRSEELIDDVVVPAHAIIHKIARPLFAQHEQRWCLALRQRLWKLNVNLAAVVEGSQRLPRRVVAGDAILKIQRVERQPGVDGRCGTGCFTCAFERDQLIIGIGPGERGHIRMVRTLELQVIAAPVSRDYEIGLQTAANGFARICTCLVAPVPLAVSPTTQRTVSPAEMAINVSPG